MDGSRLLVVIDGVAVDLLLNLIHIDVRNSILAIEDTSDFLEGGSLGLDVEEVDEDELDADPELGESVSFKSRSEKKQRGCNLQCRRE